MVDSINAIDYFRDSSLLSTEYDFNKDGKVDVLDYRDALLKLNDDDSSNDPNLTADELKTIFSSLITNEEANNKNIGTVTTDNLDEEIKRLKALVIDPDKASTLNELQTIGQNISATIKECSEIVQLMDTQIPTLTSKLEELQEKQKTISAEYELKSQQVATKQQLLDNKLQNILAENNQMSEARKEVCNKIVDNCIKEYAAGEYEGRDLADVIQDKLANSSDGGFNVSTLRLAIANASALGVEIKNLCSEITNLGSDLRNINTQVKTASNNLSAAKTNRTDIINLGKTASANYQKGYEKRTSLRTNIINTYKKEATTTNGATSSENAQVQSLSDFLNAKELNNMPYTDAYYILKEAFSGCGLKFDDDNYEISVPTGIEDSAKNIYNALASSILENYGVTVKRYDETATTATTSSTPTTTTTDGVYIVTAYNVGNSKNQTLTVGENILDFCSKTKRRGLYLAGSSDHNDDKTNDDEWLAFYNKLSDENKNLTLSSGEAYIFSKDGELLGTASAAQVANVNYSAKDKRNADSKNINNDFSVTSDLGITNKTNSSGEEGSGGAITLNGTSYNVAQTIYRKQTPLILDLKGDGLSLTDVNNGVNFDLNADGTTDRTAWTSAQSEFDNAFLVLDKNGDGQVNDGSELFGDQNGAENGFAELSKYDSNGDGKIDKNDEAYNQLKLWCDMDADGVVDEGEMKGLEEAGVAELNVNYDKKYNDAGNLLEDENGNTIGLQGSFTRTDGTSSQMTDVLFNNMDLADYNALNKASTSNSTTFSDGETSINLNSSTDSNPFGNIPDIKKLSVDTKKNDFAINSTFEQAKFIIDSTEKNIENIVEDGVEEAEKEKSSNEKNNKEQVATTDSKEISDKKLKE